METGDISDRLIHSIQASLARSAQINGILTAVMIQVMNEKYHEGSIAMNADDGGLIVVHNTGNSLVLDKYNADGVSIFDIPALVKDQESEYTEEAEG